MRLTDDECWKRLAGARHGVLATVHRRRGVDAVPVVYALSGRRLVLPVDTVKAKRHLDLQRLHNLTADGRCVLLVDHYEDDWRRLWWVRVHGSAVPVDPVSTGQMTRLLATRYPQYAEASTVAGALVLTPAAVLGWAAG